MFRLSGQIWKNGKVIASCVSRQEGAENRTKKVYTALEEICHHFDLPVPIWLPARIREFQTRSKTTFLSDSFMEEIYFDGLEIQVIEE